MLSLWNYGVYLLAGALEDESEKWKEAPATATQEEERAGHGPSSNRVRVISSPWFSRLRTYLLRLRVIMLELTY